MFCTILQNTIYIILQNTICIICTNICIIYINTICTKQYYVCRYCLYWGIFFFPPVSMQTFKKLKKNYYLKLAVFSFFLREYCNLDS